MNPSKMSTLSLFADDDSGEETDDEEFNAFLNAGPTFPTFKEKEASKVGSDDKDGQQSDKNSTNKPDLREQVAQINLTRVRELSANTNFSVSTSNQSIDPCSSLEVHPTARSGNKTVNDMASSHVTKTTSKKRKPPESYSRLAQPSSVDVKQTQLIDLTSDEEAAKKRKPGESFAMLPQPSSVDMKHRPVEPSHKTSSNASDSDEDDDDDDEDMHSKFQKLGISQRRMRRISAGDVITFYHPLYVAGGTEHLMTLKVTGVRLKPRKRIEFQLGQDPPCLTDLTHLVRLMKVVHKGTMKDVSTVSTWRTLGSLQFVGSEILSNGGSEKTERIKKIVEDAKEDGKLFHTNEPGEIN